MDCIKSLTIDDIHCQASKQYILCNVTSSTRTSSDITFDQADIDKYRHSARYGAPWRYRLQVLVKVISDVLNLLRVTVNLAHRRPGLDLTIRRQNCHACETCLFRRRWLQRGRSYIQYIIQNKTERDSTAAQVVIQAVFIIKAQHVQADISGDNGDEKEGECMRRTPDLVFGLSGLRGDGPLNYGQRFVSVVSQRSRRARRVIDRPHSSSPRQALYL